MKDSGIAWIGDVPEHWEVKRIGAFYIDNNNKNSALEFTEAYKFNYGTLVRKDEGIKLEEVADVYSKYTIISKNDIIINGLNLNYDFISQRVAKVDKKGIITSAYVAITPREDVFTDYFIYLFKSMDDKKLFHGMGTGIRLTLGYNELKRQLIPIPPLSEQQQIATYIETKVNQIDTYISITKREIEQMQEYKQRLISDAVTGKIKV
jgi:type I restriction enzyme S subunit